MHQIIEVEGKLSPGVLVSVSVGHMHPTLHVKTKAALSVKLLSSILVPPQFLNLKETPECG